MGDGVQFLLGGSGERFAEAQSLAANELQRLLYHAALTRDGVYASNTRYVYGITTPASQYALPVLKAMVLSGILRVGLAWPRDDALLHEVGDAVLDYLPTLRQLHPSAVVLPYNFTSADSAAPGFAEALLRNLTSTGTEALIACVRPGAMASLVAALTTSGLRLRSTFLYDGTHMTNLTDQYGQDMLYKLTAAQWHPRIQYADEFFGSAAAYAAGLQAFVGRPATEDTAGASAAALTLGLSLRLAFRRCNISADVAASGDTARLLLDPRALSCGPEATGDLFPELLGGAGAAGPGGNVTGVVLSPAGAIGAPPPGATGNGTQPPRPAFAVTGYRLLMAQLDKNNFATFYGACRAADAPRAIVQMPARAMSEHAEPVHSMCLLSGATAWPAACRSCTVANPLPLCLPNAPRRPRGVQSASAQCRQALRHHAGDGGRHQGGSATGGGGERAPGHARTHGGRRRKGQASGCRCLHACSSAATNEPHALQSPRLLRFWTTGCSCMWFPQLPTHGAQDISLLGC